MKYKFTYEFKQDNGFVEVRDYIATDGEDYERVIRTVYENPEKYKITTVKRIEEDKMKLTLREVISVLNNGDYPFKIRMRGEKGCHIYETASDINERYMNGYVVRLTPRYSEEAPYYGAFNSVILEQ